jgi:hypothetical protein
MAREFKVNLDDAVDQLLSQPLTGSQVTEDFLNTLIQ